MHSTHCVLHWITTHEVKAQIVRKNTNVTFLEPNIITVHKKYLQKERFPSIKITIFIIRQTRLSELLASTNNFIYILSQCINVHFIL